MSPKPEPGISLTIVFNPYRTTTVTSIVLLVILAWMPTDKRPQMVVV